jgi:hypothetical protein
MSFLSSSVSHQATNFKNMISSNNKTKHNNKTQDCYIKYNLKTTTTILHAIIYLVLDFCFFAIATNIRTKVNLLRLYQNKSTIVLGSLKQVVLKTYKLYTQANRYTIYCQLSQNPTSVKKFFLLSDDLVANTYALKLIIHHHTHELEYVFQELLFGTCSICLIFFLPLAR